MSAQQVGIFNVTFGPGCRNHWHIHQARRGGSHPGGGQALARRGPGQLVLPPGGGSPPPKKGPPNGWNR